MVLEPYFQKMVDGIAEHGWYAISVMADEKGPGFTYSIGFWETLSVPDVIIFGLPSKLMHNMLWEVFLQVQVGRKLEDGARWANLIEGFDCISRPVHKTQIPDFMLSSMWYKEYPTGSDEIEAFQMFWPGKNDGLFPWESDCPQIVQDHQPGLYLPVGAH
jgi:hypothetical protein